MSTRCPLCGRRYLEFEDLHDHMDQEHNTTFAKALKLLLDNTEEELWPDSFTLFSNPPG